MPDTGRDADEGRSGSGSGDVLHLLHGVLRSLASTTTLTDMLRVIVSRGAHQFRPVAATIACPEGHRLASRANWGSSLPIGGVVGSDRDPWSDALTLCEPVWVASAEELVERFPDVEVADGIESLAALPLVASGAAAGVLVIGFAGSGGFDGDHRAFLVMLADLCSLVLAWSEVDESRTPARRASVALELANGRGPADVVANGSSNGVSPRLGIHPRLTAREQQIALALAEGRRSSSVARDLGISIYTVRKHISAILRKYDVTSQSELIARIYRLAIPAESESA
jgi:DNA-binding CsgD family transcriptional regulator